MTQTRVLVVEDNRADARLLSELLRDVPGRPFVLETVGTLADAIRVAHEHDVVLLDLSLPDALGLVTVERMVAAARWIPIVVLTGNDDERVAMDAVKAGAQDYISKAELSPSLVARSLRYAIERKRVELSELARAKSDEAAARARFIATVTTEISRCLDLDDALACLARLVLPTLADVCAVDLVSENGSIQRVAAAGRTPELDAVATAMRAYAPGPAHPRTPALEAIQRHTTTRLVDFHPETIAPDERYRDLAAQASACSLLVTPLIARDRVVGAVTYVMGPSRRRYDDELQLLAEEVASHVALLIDNVRLLDQTQKAVRARDELLAIVSHDLRNPMGVVSLALAMLEDATDKQRDMALARAHRALDRMQRLIEDLLDVARIDRGTLRVEPKPVELSTVLDDAYELQRPLATQRRITLRRAYARPLGTASIDRDRIGQVLSNLLGNALKFTPGGGTVELGASSDAESFTVYVKDSGPGIPPDCVDHVFDRFWQRERRSDGIGLGLAIAKGIVDAHGGSIHVESPPSQGATFRFVLPR